MVAFFLSLAVDVAILSLVVAMLRLAGRVHLNTSWVLGSLALLAAYFIAIFVGGTVIPVKLVIPDPSWNWGGKIMAILFWISVLSAFVILKKDFKPADAGFVLKQRPGSVIPAVVVVTAFVVLQVLLSHLMGGNEYDAEELFFQALMPGLDEEPVFRGLLLYSVSLAVISKPFDVFGAQLNVAGLIIAALFGLVHGVSFDGQEWHLSFTAILNTGLFGAILLWLRERTGSLVYPIAAHNLVNFAGQLT